MGGAQGLGVVALPALGEAAQALELVQAALRMGQIEFKDFLWEAFTDPATRQGMGNTAENVAQKYGITREDVDAYAAQTLARANAAWDTGYYNDEVAPVSNAEFALDGYQSRFLKLADEGPVHRVRITRAFWLGQHEVTVGQFRRFIEASGHVPQSVADGTGGYGYNPAYDPATTTRGDAFEGRLPRYSWRDPGFAQGDRIPPRRFGSFQHDRAGIGFLQTGNALDQLGLPVPFDSGNPDDLAPANAQTETIEGIALDLSLSPSTVKKMASPGNTESHGAVVIWSRASESMLPQLGKGGRMPRPRNDSAASDRMAPPMPRVAITISGPRMLGSTCVNMMRRSP